MTQISGKKLKQVTAAGENLMPMIGDHCFRAGLEPEDVGLAIVVAMVKMMNKLRDHSKDRVGANQLAQNALASLQGSLMQNGYAVSGLTAIVSSGSPIVIN